MLDYKLLEALAAVLQWQSFERAAEQLCITQSAVSQRIRLLEERMGQPVLIRGTPLKATAEGEKLLAHVQKVQLLEHSLQQELQAFAQDEFTHMRLAVNADSLTIWLLPVFAQLFEQQRVLVDLVVEDQDFTLTKLKKGEVIGCVSAQEAQVPGCNRTLLGVMPYVMVATPVFAQRYFPNGMDRASLSQAPAILFGPNDLMQDRYLSRFHQLGPGDYPYHVVPSVDGFVGAISRGIAYGLVPEVQIRAELAAGTLVNLAPANPLPVALYWYHWRLQTPALAALGKLLVKEAGKVMEPA